MRTNRLLLHPFVVIAVLFFAQALAWYLLMQEHPPLATMAPRFADEVGLARYLCLFAALLTGAAAGDAWLKRAHPGTSGADTPPQWRIRLYLALAGLSLLMSFTGEIFYVRHLLANPRALIAAFFSGTLDSFVYTQARSQQITGLSSLNNFVFLPVAIYSAIAYARGVSARHRKQARFGLAVLLVLMAVHAMVLTSRLWLVSSLLTVAAAYLVFTNRKLKARVLVAALIGLVFLTWIAETFRTGAWYAVVWDKSVFSSEVQEVVLVNLSEGYMASDFNNAMVILSSPPALQMVYMTFLNRFMGPDAVGYDELPNWRSAHGTVNVLGLWWFDWGWAALGIALLAGFYLGAVYRWGLRDSPTLGTGFVLFLLTWPGLFSLLRINFYASTMYVLPLAMLFAFDLAVRAAQAAQRSRGCPRTGAVTE